MTELASAGQSVEIGGRAYEVHPVAALFPDADAEVRRRMREDIEARGVRRPVEVQSGFLLDGRTRLSICEELGIEAPWVEVPADVDAVGWILSANVHRRHLSTSQRAVLAAELVGVSGGGAEGMTLEEAAEAVNVSRMSVARAKAVGDGGSEELRSAVRDGTVTVADAYKVRDAERGALDEAVREVREGRSRSLSQALGRESGGARSSAEAGGDGGGRGGGALRLPALPGDEDGGDEAPEVFEGDGRDGSEWELSQDLADRARMALGGGVDCDGSVVEDGSAWAGRVLWCPRDGVLRGVEDRLSAGLEAADGLVMVTRCEVHEEWAQEVWGNPALTAVAFGAGARGVRQWVVTDVSSGPVMVWGFRVDMEAFRSAFEGFGVVVGIAAPGG